MLWKEADEMVPPYILRVPYAMFLRVPYAMFLRVRRAMSGTHISYPDDLLRVPYAMSGTMQSPNAAAMCGTAATGPACGVQRVRYRHHAWCNGTNRVWYYQVEERRLLVSSAISLRAC
eukprot:2107043-Rhodomonas_salina.1